MTKWIILVGVILAICLIEWIREINTFRVTNYAISSEKLNGMNEKRIVFLSDLHNQEYGCNNSKLLQKIKEQNPSLILVGGDMLIGKKNVSTHVAETFIIELTKIAPVYYANGNHEFRMKAYEEIYEGKNKEYKEKLEQHGVIFLENDYVELELGNKKIEIYGLEIPKETYKKFTKVALTLQQMEELLAKSEDDHYRILLAHNPVFMDTYEAWGADLILSGHLHGGVVRLPGIGGVISPQFKLFPKYSGELTVKDNCSIVVSKGLGTHTIPIRFLNPAEVVVLSINGK